MESRKEHKPKNIAIDIAAAMGIEILSDEQYRQKPGNFDEKTSSWVKTPSEIRKLGGAFFLIGATVISLFITTVRSHITAPGGFAAR